MLRNSDSSAWEAGGMPSAIRHRRTSEVGITPSFSPLRGSEKRLKASRISFSSAAVMLCSLASLDRRGLGVESVGLEEAGALRFGG